MAAGVVQGFRGDVAAHAASDAAVLVVESIGNRCLQRAGGHQAGAVAQVLRLELKVAAGVAAVIGIHPGFDDGAVAQLPAAAQADAILGGDILLYREVALGLYVHGLAV